MDFFISCVIMKLNSIPCYSVELVEVLLRKLASSTSEHERSDIFVIEIFLCNILEFQFSHREWWKHKLNNRSKMLLLNLKLQNCSVSRLSSFCSCHSFFMYNNLFCYSKLLDVSPSFFIAREILHVFVNRVVVSWLFNFLRQCQLCMYLDRDRSLRGDDDDVGELLRKLSKSAEK